MARRKLRPYTKREERLGTALVRVILEPRSA